MLKFSYDKKEDIPENQVELYSEVDGKWVLTGVEGVKSEADLSKLQGALQNERDAHKATKKELQDQLKELQKQIEDVKSLPPAEPKKPEGGKTDDPSILALRKELEKQQAALDELKSEREKLEQEKKQHSILDSLRNAANGKVRIEAMSDLELYRDQFEITQDGNVVAKDGTQLTDWLDSTLKNKPHWIPTNTPAGATGGAGGKDSNSLDAKKAKLSEFAKKDTLTPRELAEAHKIAAEVKAETTQ